MLALPMLCQPLVPGAIPERRGYVPNDNLVSKGRGVASSQAKAKATTQAEATAKADLGPSPGTLAGVGEPPLPAALVAGRWAYNAGDSWKHLVSMRLCWGGPVLSLEA
jgi:hypothetical protein